MLNSQIDLLSIGLQLLGAWTSAIQVLRAYKKNPIHAIKVTWDGKVGQVEYTNEFQRFTKFMKMVFIIGLILISIGLVLPLVKNQGDQMPHNKPPDKTNTNSY